ncbi:hypothetical protein GCM10018771_46520 [Streptomyces cellulosae]|nr:hypothetical protein GCM10018771_46520 [Streptomyces cellulosae]
MGGRGGQARHEVVADCCAWAACGETYADRVHAVPLWEGRGRGGGSAASHVGKGYGGPGVAVGCGSVGAGRAVPRASEGVGVSRVRRVRAGGG